MSFAARASMFVAVVCTALGGCSSKHGALADPETTELAPQCAPELPDACPDPPPTFAADVEPLIAARCTTCHGQLEGFWPLRTYKEVVDWEGLVRTMLLDCTMPPPDAGSAMTDSERNTVLTWLSCGKPM